MWARILVADDEAALREVLVEVLEAAGYVVTVAETGQQALDLALPGSFDLLILDEVLPERQGRQVIAALRAAGIQVPAILISGHLRLSAEEQQALDVKLLEKPIQLDVFLDEVAQALARH